MMRRPTAAQYVSAALALLALTAGAQEASTQPLLAFVGQKLKVEQFVPPDCKPQASGGTERICILIDAAFHAEYRVIQPVHGQYGDAAIRFDAFDHYGWPAFARYEHVLLFVTRGESGRWFHVKYQYFPVYETQDGGWAGCGSADRFAPASQRGPSTARPIAFKVPPVESLAELSPAQIAAWFPLSDWDHVDGKAICRQGTPLAELFEAKKRGTLKAVGLFG